MGGSYQGDSCAMNDLQKKIFELLQIFVGICEKWNIKYYLVCGSALGAVKYQGFIPWDDDVDVGLLRQDYQRFLEVAPQELPDWCFLQNYKTERLFPHTFTKLRNSNTTLMESGASKLSINHGIFIDIFPIDGHPKSKAGQKLFELKQKMNTWIRFSVYENSDNPRIRKRNKILRLLGFHHRTAKAIERLNKLYSKYSTEDSELWCNYGNWQGKLEYAPRWHYGEGTWAVFEGLRVRIPEKYDAYLTQKYGDWRAELPEQLQRSHHKVTVCDVEKPYAFYLSEQKKRNRIDKSRYSAKRKNSHLQHQSKERD